MGACPDVVVDLAGRAKQLMVIILVAEATVAGVRAPGQSVRNKAARKEAAETPMMVKQELHPFRI